MTYQISDDAVIDLKEIAQYTSEMWGGDAVENYVSEIFNKLDAIGRGNIIKEHYGDSFPELYVTRFRNHLIFYQVKEGKVPLIMRILHHKQDKLRHLNKTFLNLG